jgi:hypothetical protein
LSRATDATSLNSPLTHDAFEEAGCRWRLGEERDELAAGEELLHRLVRGAGSVPARGVEHLGQERDVCRLRLTALLQNLRPYARLQGPDA